MADHASLTPKKRLLSGWIALCVALGPLEPAFAAARRMQTAPGAAINGAPALTPASLPAANALPLIGQLPALPAPAQAANPAAAAPAEEAAPPVAEAQKPALAAAPEAVAGAASAEASAILRAATEPGSVSAGAMHDAGVALESAMTGETVGKLSRRPDGSWRAVRRDAGGLTGHVLASLRHLRKGGIDVAYKKISLGAAGLTAEGESSSHILFSVQELGRLEKLAHFQGLTVPDKLAQGLVRRHLEEGLVEPLRFGREETAALGLNPETALTAAQVVGIYKDHWIKKVEGFLNQLDLRLPAPDQSVLEGRKGKIIASYSDPGSKSLILVRSNGLVERRGIDDSGRLDAKRTILHKFATGIEPVYFDPVSRKLGVVSDQDEIISINVDDPRSNGAHTVLPGWLCPDYYDPASRVLVTHDLQTLHLWKLSPDGLVADKPFQVLPDHLLTTMVGIDRKGGEFGSLITLGFPGLIEVRLFQADGRVKEKPIQSFSVVSPDEMEGARLAIDSDLRILYFYSTKGHSSTKKRTVTGWRINADGSIDVSFFLHFDIPPDIPPVSEMHVDPASHALLMFADDSRVLRYDFKSYFAREVPRNLILDVLTAPLPDADADMTRSIFRLAASAGRNEAGLSPYGRDLIDGLAARMVSPTFLSEASKTARLKAVPGSFQWFQDAETDLRRRMPDLWRALHDPVELGGLLDALSRLRILFRYDAINFLYETALDFAREMNVEFKWQGLNVVPISASFRRFILYAEDKDGLYAVELKMPGENEDRNVIHPAHFEAAQELWQRYPDDPGTVKPLFYGQYKGKTRMYGKPFDFSGAERLGVMLFEYQDGKRLKNARPKSAKDLLRALESPAATAIRLHDLGWSGIVRGPQGMTDMHDENIRLLADGEGTLVGDFGAFEKRALTPEQRREETLELLGLSPKKTEDSAVLESLAPLVIERLSRGVSDPARREAIAARVRDELGAPR